MPRLQSLPALRSQRKVKFGHLPSSCLQERWQLTALLGLGLSPFAVPSHAARTTDRCGGQAKASVPAAASCSSVGSSKELALTFMLPVSRLLLYISRQWLQSSHSQTKPFRRQRFLQGPTATLLKNGFTTLYGILLLQNIFFSRNGTKYQNGYAFHRTKDSPDYLSVDTN